MRLINTTSGGFREFFDSQRPSYAILSHTWGNEELSYLDVLSLNSNLPANVLGAVHVLLRNPSRDSEGYKKVAACCKVARERGFEWVWIDSCCIDKSSSAELSEAINSMWRWYRDAGECYAYLSDITFGSNDLPLGRRARDALKDARWFTRGWTLQEMLAPRQVVFFNNVWEALASKDQIAQDLSAITGIPLGYLTGLYDPSDCKICSTAMKMSWVSRRETTRIEDMAYCMLGLFDVQMPLIYGEGRKAFMRLQLEILRKIDDDSIYAWTDKRKTSGLLADWPSAFANSGNIVQFSFPDDRTLWLPPVMTSIGLEMRGRYQREDAHQQAVDRRYGVQTISMAYASGPACAMAMHCGPCWPNAAPITQILRRQNIGKSLVIQLIRVGASWQRVNCDRLEFDDYKLYEPSELNAYEIYYIPQDGV